MPAVLFRVAVEGHKGTGRRRRPHEPGHTRARFAALLLAKAATGAELVQVRSCYDGDTCTTTTGEKIRLACIDTPELKGKRADPVPAKAARDHLRSLVVGQTVGIRRITTDRYGRTVAELFVDGSNVQQQLIASRHAEIYWKCAHQCGWTR